MSTAFISPAALQRATPRLRSTAFTHLSKRPGAPTSRAHRLVPARMAANPPKRNDKVLEGPIDGRYGQWYLRQSDADGVLTYRSALAGMSVCATAAVALALTAGSEAPWQAYDFIYVVNLAFFGIALQTIHIYLKPMHNLLKLCWGLSLAGSAVLALSPLLEGNGVVEAVYQHPALLLAIGWQFVALTGLFIKEAFCFGRMEALSLIALTPVLAGGHFLGVLPVDVERYGAILFAALFLFFSARKFTQDAKDDIGDMSVFEHLAKGGSL